MNYLELPKVKVIRKLGSETFYGDKNRSKIKVTPQPHKSQVKEPINSPIRNQNQSSNQSPSAQKSNESKKVSRFQTSEHWFKPVPPDCIIDYNEQELSTIAKSVLKNVNDQSNNFNRRRTILKQIQEKIEDLQDQRKPQKASQKRQHSLLMQRRVSSKRKEGNALDFDEQSRHSMVIKNPKDLKLLYTGNLEPYQYYLNNSQNESQSKKPVRVSHIAYKPDDKLQNKQMTIEQKLKQMSMNLKIEEDIQQLATKIGIVPRERFGDTLTSNQNQENLKKIIQRHYKRTKMRDHEQSIKELRMFFSGSEVTQQKQKIQQHSQTSYNSPQNHNKSPKIQVGILNDQKQHNQSNYHTSLGYIETQTEQLSINGTTSRVSLNKSMIDKGINDSIMLNNKNSIFGNRKASQDVFHKKLLLQNTKFNPLLATTHNHLRKETNQFTIRENLVSDKGSYDEQIVNGNDDNSNTGINSEITTLVLNKQTPNQKSNNSIKKKANISQQRTPNGEDFSHNKEAIKKRITEIVQLDINSMNLNSEQSLPPPNFIETIIASNEKSQIIHVANKYQFNEVQQLFDSFYNYYEPKMLKRLESYQKSYKKMSLKDIEKLANKNNILKFDIDKKLSKHLNRILSMMHKDDSYYFQKYQAFLRLNPEEKQVNQSSLFQRITRGMTESFMQRLAGSKIVEEQIIKLRNNVQKMSTIQSKHNKDEVSFDEMGHMTLRDSTQNEQEQSYSSNKDQLKQLKGYLEPDLNEIDSMIMFQSIQQSQQKQNKKLNVIKKAP